MRGARPSSDFVRPISLDGEDIRALLPHREPMNLIESAPWVEPGRLAVAVTRPLALERTGVPRRGDGTVPDPLLVEVLAQAAALAVVGEFLTGIPSVERARAVPDLPAVLAAVPEFRFEAPVPLGTSATVIVEVERRTSRHATVGGEIFAGSVRAASGRVLLALAIG